MFEDDFEDYKFPLLGLVRLPEVNIEPKLKEDLGLNKDCSNYEFLCKLVKNGYELKKHKLNPEKLEEYWKRAEYELGIFEELGFTDYVLLVWLVINKMKELKHFIDYGRGSCSGSFCFALLDITGILDVIDKGLIFERFISKVRSKKQVIDGITYLKGDLICDVDINTGGVRENIVEWLEGIYKGKICKISAFSSLTGKILIKDVYKTVNEVNEEEAKRVADLVEKHFGIVEDIEKMPEKNKEFDKWTKEFPKTFNCALNLRDLLRQKTSHASGYFISYYDLDSFVPMELNREKELTLSYEMVDSSKFGTKLDLLGLTQNVILTEFFNDIPENPQEIELDTNPIVYNALQTEFLPYGLYQISADCAYKVTRHIKPKNLSELSDVNAIARPGALDYLDSYVENTAQSPHKVFDNVIKESRNLFLYQEQLMKSLVAIGFSLDDAETCRKIVGKKLVKEVAQWEQKIKDKVKENNLPEELSSIVWKCLNDSAKYSFNKSHSLSTAKLGALTVWCKYKHPLQFYKACLNATKDLPNPTEEISLIQQELPYFNIKLLPPHILKSKEKFIIEGENIRYPLNSIKGISEKTLEKLRGFCHPYSNKFEIMQAVQECKLGINVASSIIACGAMDDFLTKESRANTILELALFNQLTPREKEFIMRKKEGENESILGKQFNYNLIEIIKYLSKPQDGSEKPFIKESRLKTLRADFMPYKKIYDINSKNEELCNFILEKTLLGYSYSQNIVNILKKEYPDLTTINEIKGALDGEKFIFGGELSNYKTGKSKNGNKYIKCTINDNTAQIDVLLMEKGRYKGKEIDQFEQNTELNNNNPLEDGIIVCITGRKGKDNIVFADKIVNQNVKILTKVSELPKDSPKQS